MTDLALLKSRIAVFAGQDVAPMEPTSDWVATFFEDLTGQDFDALHLRNGDICAMRGAGKDFAQHIAQLHIGAADTPVAHICAADHDPERMLFLAAHGTDTLIIRSRSIPVDQLLALWRATD